MKAELLILGVLHRGNFHPYEIKRRLMNAMVECFTDVDVGTLYYAIRQLATRKLIEAIARERVARGGLRTIYRITARGKRRFQDLLHQRFEEAGSVADTLYDALLFLHLSDLPRVATALELKLKQQNEAIRELAEVHKRFAPMLSTGGKYLIKHLEHQRRLDRQLVQQLLVEVNAGRIFDVPDPKQLEPGRRE